VQKICLQITNHLREGHLKSSLHKTNSVIQMLSKRETTVRVGPSNKKLRIQKNKPWRRKYKMAMLKEMIHPKLQ
jgi:hypothetical protein